MNRKRGLLLLLSALVMFGCGGAGTSASSSAPGTGPVEDPAAVSGPVGYIRLSFAQQAHPLSVAADTASMPSADSARVVVRNTQTMETLTEDEEGNLVYETVTREIFRKVLDVDLTGTLSATIAVPEASGYTVEVLSSVRDAADATVHILLKYGKSDPIDVTAGVTTEISLSAVPVSEGMTIAPPSPVVAGSKYNVSIAKGIPLRNEFYLAVSETPIADRFVHGPSDVLFKGSAASLTAPTKTDPGPYALYFQGEFFLDDSLMTEAEQRTPKGYEKWRFHCPDPVYNGDVSTVLQPLGEVDVVVSLSN